MFIIDNDIKRRPTKSEKEEDGLSVSIKNIPVVIGLYFSVFVFFGGVYFDTAVFLASFFGVVSVQCIIGFSLRLCCGFLHRRSSGGLDVFSTARLPRPCDSLRQF